MVALLYLLSFLMGASAAFAAMLILRAKKRLPDTDVSAEKAFYEILRY